MAHGKRKIKAEMLREHAVGGQCYCTYKLEWRHEEWRAYSLVGLDTEREEEYDTNQKQPVMCVRCEE